MDLEKQSHYDAKDANSSSDTPEYLQTYNDDSVVDPGEAQVSTIRQRSSLLRSLRNFETWLDSKMKFEAMGVERVPENMRKPPQVLNVSCHARCTQSLANIWTTG